MEYERELTVLRELRAKTFHVDFLFLALFILIAIGVLSSYDFLLIFSPVLWALLYFRVLKTAHYPCPRCEQPFGNKSNFVLSIGGKNCQNCGLSIKLNSNSKCNT